MRISSGSLRNSLRVKLRPVFLVLPGMTLCITLVIFWCASDCTMRANLVREVVVVQFPQESRSIVEAGSGFAISYNKTGIVS